MELYLLQSVSSADFSVRLTSALLPALTYKQYLHQIQCFFLVKNLNARWQGNELYTVADDGSIPKPRRDIVTSSERSFAFLK